MHTPLTEIIMGKLGRSRIEIGDRVQYVSNGIAQFKKPKEVTEIKSHEGVSFAFFKGSSTGIPINKLEKR